MGKIESDLIGGNGTELISTAKPIRSDSIKVESNNGTSNCGRFGRGRVGRGRFGRGRFGRGTLRNEMERKGTLRNSE